LGKSPNKLEFIAPKEYIDLVYLQQLFDDSIDKRDEAKALELKRQIDDFSVFDDYKNIKHMYSLRNEAAYEYYIKLDPARASTCIRQAIEITAPGINGSNLQEYMLSTIELENILFLCLMMTENDENTEESIRQLVDAVLSYIEQHISDREEQAYIVPKVKWLSGILFLKAGETRKAVEECSAGLELLRRDGLLQMSIPLLDVITEYGQGCDLPDQFEDYREYKDLIEKLSRKYMDKKACFDSLFLDTERAIYHYEAEVYRGQRLLKQLTQDNIADFTDSSSDIVSRYERGRRSPRPKNYTKLVDVLDIEYSKQGTFLVSENFRLLEDERTINSLLIREKYDLAEEKHRALSRKIDCSVRSNWIILTVQKNLIGLLNGTLTSDTVLKEDLDLLDETYPIHRVKVERPPFLMESNLLAQIYSCYRTIGKLDTACDLCDKVAETFDHSYVPKILQQRTVGVHVSNQPRYHKDYSYVKEAITLRLECRNLNGLDMILSSYAAHIYTTNKIISREYADLSLAAAKLHRVPNILIIKEFIEKWY
jgi:transcriptional regulator with XRE-family HTH domain